MTNQSSLYWLTRLDPILNMSSVLIAVSSVALIIFCIIIYGMIPDMYNYTKERKKELFKSKRGIRNAMITVLLISILIQLFLPSRNEAIFIVAGGKTLDYVQSDTSLSKIPYQATTIISQYLDNQLKQIKDSN